MLELRVVGFTNGATQWEVTKKPTWWGGVVELFFDRADRNSGDTGCFENMSERTDRTRAEGSDRCQKYNVDFVLLK